MTRLFYWCWCSYSDLRAGGRLLPGVLPPQVQRQGRPNRTTPYLPTLHIPQPMYLPSWVKDPDPFRRIRFLKLRYVGSGRKWTGSATLQCRYRTKGLLRLFRTALIPFKVGQNKCNCGFNFSYTAGTGIV